MDKYNLYSDVNDVNIIKLYILELCKKMCEYISERNSTEYVVCKQIHKNLVKNKNI